MKYSELHRKLRKAGCYPTGNVRSGHPEWYSPITKASFTTSHHESKEVANGTLKSIRISSGVKL
ncbi:MAG: type II toxin-antitoxin system HicA family toxin [Bacteroides sp.]|nr:type II toxin-antitoxin system HicA family toxin [Bacteroides sp.]